MCRGAWWWKPSRKLIGLGEFRAIQAYSPHFADRATCRQAGLLTHEGPLRRLACVAVECCDSPLSSERLVSHYHWPTHRARLRPPVAAPPLLPFAWPVPLTAADARTNARTVCSQQITPPAAAGRRSGERVQPSSRPPRPPPGPNPSHHLQQRRRRGRHAVPGGRAGRAAHLLRDVRRAAAARQPPRRPLLLARGKPPAPSPCSCSSPIGSIESLRLPAWLGGLFNRACPRWYGS